MRQLTPILSIFITADFFDEANKEGEVIDFVPQKILSLYPEPRLKKTIDALRGRVEIGDYTRVCLPADFSGAIPLTPVDLLPSPLFFYLHALKPEPLRASGIDFGKRVLLLTPSGEKQPYTFRKEGIQCMPVGSGRKIGAADLVHHLPANTQVETLGRLMEAPLGTAGAVIDLQVTIGDSTVPLGTEEELRQLHQVLASFVLQTVPIRFERRSNGTLLKEIPKILVTPQVLPAGVIGIVLVPVGQIQLTANDPAAYRNLNLFVVHLPSFRARVELTVNTDKFNGGSKLLFEGKVVAGPTVQDHPTMTGYKQVTATVEAYTPYLYKAKRLEIQSGRRKTGVPVDPLAHYNPATNISSIAITT